MEFLPKEVEEFRARYTEVFGETLTEDEALDMMDRLIWFYDVVAQGQRRRSAPDGNLSSDTSQGA